MVRNKLTPQNDELLSEKFLVLEKLTNKWQDIWKGGDNWVWLIKAEEETDPSYGKHPENRSIPELIRSSIILIDKNCGPTGAILRENRIRLLLG